MPQVPIYLDMHLDPDLEAAAGRVNIDTLLLIQLVRNTKGNQPASPTPVPPAPLPPVVTPAPVKP
jgi:hypothetical protein